MTFKGAIRWSLRPKRVAVMVAKLLLAGSTDLAAQTTSWQEVNSGLLHIAIHLEDKNTGKAEPENDLKVNRDLAFDLQVEGYDPGPQARMGAQPSNALQNYRPDQKTLDMVAAMKQREQNCKDDRACLMAGVRPDILAHFSNLTTQLNKGSIPTTVTWKFTPVQ
jgi:hypothetical protein